MPVIKGKSKKDRSKHSRLNAFTRGGIFYLALAGFSMAAIMKMVDKPAGGHPSKGSINDVIATANANGGKRWDGQVEGGAGRPRSTTPALDKAIVKLVFKFRGRIVVTAKFVRKTIRAARKVSLRTIERRLGDAGLAWLRRRRKSIVPEVHRAARLRWAVWVLTRTVATLARWCYTDGTTFYLARCQAQHQDKQWAKLGPMVWRMADGSDALFEECIGPSAYWKAQGLPVRVWGLLVAGWLFVTILPEHMTMTAETYVGIIKKNFAQWLQQGLGRRAAARGAFLVQDHEKCLWKDGPQDALKEAGVTLLDFPKCSQDLNPIEICWRELRARMDVTAPTDREHRSDFVKRLKNAVAWLNVNRHDYFLKLCYSQKEWARDVQAAKPPGSRTKH